MLKYLIFTSIILSAFSCNNQKLSAELIKAVPEKGFNFPYYLFIPEKTSTLDSLYLIVEPNNSGFVDDNFKKHAEKAKHTASLDFYMGNYLARKLNYPLLVPVFPRTRTQWKLYTHALDRDVMVEKNTDLERIDLQLLAMIDDAKNKLEAKNHRLKNKVLITGFSASGTFANRFTLLHPEKVKALAAGGLNGLLMLPVDTLNQKALIYPVGTADFKQLTNQDFNFEAFQNTPQFLFMGENDDNDAIPYDDGYDEEERSIIYEEIGKEMMPKRWDFCQSIYVKKGINAKIKIYKGIGHEQPDKVKQDVLKFFKQVIR